MKHWIMAFGLLFLCSLTVPSGAQTAASPDSIVALHEGIQYYLRGRVETRDEDERLRLFSAAIERFDSVLETDPNNANAIWFRALSHGGSALAHRVEKQRSQTRAATNKRVLTLRKDPRRRDQLTQDIEKAKGEIADASPAEQKVLQAFVNKQGSYLRIMKQKSELSIDELNDEIAAARRGAVKFAEQERQSYTTMLADLHRLIPGLGGPQAVLQLIEVMANANIARIDEQAAVAIKDRVISRSQASGPPNALREAAAARLSDAVQILVSLLETDLEPLDAVRARFFLGVLRFRQAVPSRSAREEQPPLDPQRRAWLNEAERIMTSLSDDPDVPVRWQSYSALYAGLIIPFRAVSATEVDARNAILDQAERRLDQAAELHLRAGDSASDIPNLVWRQRREAIAPLRTDVPLARKRQDLTLSLFAGVRRDTNVVLLGERTDLPRDLSRKRDFAFTAGAAIDYTWDFADRWSMGLQMRTAQLWNVDVDEFDQQSYGGSFALQYEMVPVGKEFGPAYLTLQYDHDYTLLGRSGFLASNALRPGVRMYWNEQRAQTDIFLDYEIRNYFEPVGDKRFNRDGTYFTIGATHRLKLTEMTAIYERMGLEPWGHEGDQDLQQTDLDYPNRYLTPFVSASYSWDSTAGDEFDRKAWRLAIGLEFPLPRGWLLEASAAYDWEEYPQGSLVDFHRRVRHDFIQEYGIALSRTYVLEGGEFNNRFTPTMDRTTMRIRAFFTWTGDDSNVVDRQRQAIFEYDRVVYGMSVLFTFN